MAIGTQTQPQGKLLDYEQFIDHQLQRTRRRIKFTDIIDGVLDAPGGLPGGPVPRGRVRSRLRHAVLAPVDDPGLRADDKPAFTPRSVS